MTDMEAKAREFAKKMGGTKEQQSWTANVYEHAHREGMEAALQETKEICRRVINSPVICMDPGEAAVILERIEDLTRTEETPDESCLGCRGASVAHTCKEKPKEEYPYGDPLD